MTNLKNLIGLDIGATSIKAGFLEVTQDPRCETRTKASIVARLTRHLDPEDKTESGMVAVLGDIVQALCCERGVPLAEVQGVGMGAPGIFDVEKGLLIRAPNLPLLRDFPLAARLSEKIGLPSAADNDVNVIGLGEAWQGAARGKRNMILLALGTGCGGALMLNGKLWRGEDGMATEFGHINIHPDGPPCGCGSHGCLEQYASQTGLIRIVKQDNYRPVLDTIDKDSDIPLRLSVLAREGDEYCQGVFDTMGEALGIALADLSNSLNVHCVLFGGGLSRSYDLFLPSMKKALFRYAYQAVAERVELRLVDLWEDGGLYGAAALLLPEFAG